MTRVLGVVPARGGSKGIPGKNLRSLAGKPLLWYTARAAADSGVLDRTILTTDSREIAEVGRELGLDVPFLRPSELAQDATPMVASLVHAVGEVEREGWTPDVVVLLQPTAPLRRPEHIRSAVELLLESGASSVVSVAPVPPHYAPHYVMKIEGGRLVNFLPEGERVTRRQDAPPAYYRDGTVYVVRRSVLMNGEDLYGNDCKPLLLEPEETVTLDTESDWIEASARLSS
jgi:CMP-N-acetylneuraminic acid synthetase